MTIFCFTVMSSLIIHKNNIDRYCDIVNYSKLDRILLEINQLLIVPKNLKKSHVPNNIVNRVRSDE